jgi:hypothetical protein
MSSTNFQTILIQFSPCCVMLLMYFYSFVQNHAICHSNSELKKKILFNFIFLPITFSLKRRKIDRNQIRFQNFFICKVRLCQSELVFLKKVNYISKDLLKTFYRYRCKIWSTHKSLVSGVKIASQASIWSRLLSVNWTFFIFFFKHFLRISFNLDSVCQPVTCALLCSRPRFSLQTNSV